MWAAEGSLGAICQLGQSQGRAEVGPKGEETQPAPQDDSPSLQGDAWETDMMVELR